jgi:hypothetical protein
LIKGVNPSKAREDRVFPDPDSPTIATVSPFSRKKEKSETTGESFCSLNTIFRFSTFSIGFDMKYFPEAS